MKKSIVGKRYFMVKDCIFNRKVHVLLNHGDKDFDKWAKKNKYANEISSSPNFLAFSSQIDGAGHPTEWIICLKRFNWTISDQGSLIHEIVHTVIKIFASNNIGFNQFTQEFLAHAVGNLYEDISVKIFRVTKKRKRT